MISTGLHGGATAGTISVPSKKLLLTVLYRCLPTPLHYGDLDRFQATGSTLLGGTVNGANVRETIAGSS